MKIVPHGMDPCPHGTEVALHGMEADPHGMKIIPHGKILALHKMEVKSHGTEVAPRGIEVVPCGMEDDLHGKKAAPCGTYRGPGRGWPAPRGTVTPPLNHWSLQRFMRGQRAGNYSRLFLACCAQRGKALIRKAPRTKATNSKNTDQWKRP